MMVIQFKKICLVMLCLCAMHSYGQQTERYRNFDKHYRIGLELFEKEKYSAAEKEFDKVILNRDLVAENEYIDAQYYKAASAAALYHPDAVMLLNNFISNYPSESKTRLAWFQLAILYFKEKKWKSATEYFEKIDVSYLNDAEISEYYFKSGYSYFMKGDNLKAIAAFRQITNVENKYRTAANYYFGHISYLNKNYETALNTFQSLRGAETFGVLVPQYITHIYFVQAKYDSCIVAAKEAIETPGAQNVPEIKRMMAEAYYRKGDYNQASVLFLEYQKTTPSLTRDDLYKIGYTYYKVEKYNDAILNFQKVVNVNDTMAQKAYYHLGDCFLKTKNKQSARNAFQFAAKSDFDAAITEDALFNFGKLSFELGFQPQAITTFTQYVKNYPTSHNKDICNEYLAKLYLQTKNYKEALALLESLKDKNPTAKEAFQKVAYYRGNELYNDGDYSKAIGLYEKAIINNVDNNMAAYAIYWKAEALYKQQKYEAAIKQFRTFVFYPSSVNIANHDNALYDLGYCHFKLKQYTVAGDWFRKFIAAITTTGDIRAIDARVRIADVGFISGNYDVAREFYTAAITAKSSATDYCLFQKGMIDGIQDNHEAKIFAMQNIQESFPKSNYYDDAIFESGDAYFINGDNENAVKQFETIINSKKGSSYVSKAYLKLGLIYFNKGENKKAYDTFKQVVETNPRSNESMEALMQMKNIAVKEGNPDDFIAYMSKLPLPKASDGAQDSLYYETAENFLEKQEYEKASAAFGTYISKFPQGNFALNANFYNAECLVKINNFSEALIIFERIIDGPKNLFTEKSLFRAAAINFKNKEYSKALVQFERLEQTAEYKDNIIASYAGQMRCNYYLDKYDNAIIAAQKVLATDKLQPELANEAHLIYARCAIAKDDIANAQREYKEVEKIGNSERAAEARYNLALIQYKQKNYKEAEKGAFLVIRQLPSYDYWIAKSFILLGDNYIALADTFQAKSTLKSVLDNYKPSQSDKDDILKIAQEKYDTIIADENTIFRKPQNDELEFDTDSLNNKQ